MENLNTSTPQPELEFSQDTTRVFCSNLLFGGTNKLENTISEILGELKPGKIMKFTTFKLEVNKLL